MMKLVVLCCMFAAAAASAPFYSYAAPLARFAPFAPFSYAVPLAQPYNYRGPLSLAPGQPAEVLGADGRPLDTLEVNLDRSAHFAAKTGLHLLKKRSAPLIAAPISRLAVAAPVAYSAPIAAGHISYAAPIAPIIRPITYAAPIIRTF